MTLLVNLLILIVVLALLLAFFSLLIRVICALGKLGAPVQDMLQNAVYLVILLVCIVGLLDVTGDRGWGFRQYGGTPIVVQHK